MAGLVFVAVLAAAGMHAAWNAIAKLVPDHRVSAGLLGGLLALVAYGVVLWAQTRAPLALVAILRETSVLFAGVLGTLVFKERLTAARMLATVAAVVGLVLLQST